MCVWLITSQFCFVFYFQPTSLNFEVAFFLCLFFNMSLPVMAPYLSDSRDSFGAFMCGCRISLAHVRQSGMPAGQRVILRASEGQGLWKHNRTYGIILDYVELLSFSFFLFPFFWHWTNVQRASVSGPAPCLSVLKEIQSGETDKKNKR